ncbi:MULTISPECIES: acyl carrier protein [Bacillus]|uniref:acyl carrier protein n=1 Tax=Bacillus TaxID=1386 RepID=UPI000BF41F13|nr:MULTISPECIES: acyl carrier protein [Bacillus]PFX72055.1 phosphopantetheine attachment protein [Bacillus cereus]PGD11775.1 phosphopantetheine attachment protein [Bacillus toyonensis]PRP92096.1 acyl carrier protein [Bacillus sp. M21]
MEIRNLSVNNLIEDITKMVVETLNLAEAPQLTDDLKTLGMDSLNTVSLIIKLEGCFNFEFDDHELHPKNFSTILNIIQLVENKISPK